MDFATLDVRAFASKGAKLELIHPVTKKGTRFFLHIIGRDAEEYQENAFARAEEKAEEARRARLANRPGGGELTPQSFYDEQVQDAVFCTTGWHEEDGQGVVVKETATIDGAEVVFSKANVEKFYRRFPWVLEQALSGQANRAVFIPASATN